MAMAVRTGLEAVALYKSPRVEVTLSNGKLVTMRAGMQTLLHRVGLTKRYGFTNIHTRSATLKCNSRLPGDLDLTGFTHMNFGEWLQQRTTQLGVQVKADYCLSICIFPPNYL